MGEGEADALRLQLGEREHVAGIVDEAGARADRAAHAARGAGRLRDRRLGNRQRRDLDAPTLQMGGDLREFGGVRKGPSARITAR